MSLYADILRDHNAFDDDVRQDGNTWTVISLLLDEEIPGFQSKEIALAVVRGLRCAREKGVEAAGYS